MDLTFGNIVCETNQKYEHAFFPVSGFISLLTVADDHHPLEVGLSGNEGMLGVSLILGVNNAPLQSLVQGSGICLHFHAIESRLARWLLMTQDRVSAGCGKGGLQR